MPTSGRICFHLAENKNNEKRPFAFLATHIPEALPGQPAKHLPLKAALEMYSQEKNNEALLTLLVPVQQAAAKNPFVQSLLDSGGLFQAMTWTAHEAHAFLRAIPVIEASGILVRVPNWWNAHKPTRPQVVVTIGETTASCCGVSTLLNFDMRLALSDGIELTQEELQSLLKASSKLVKVKEHWVEVDPEKLQSVLAHWEQLKHAQRNGITMAEGLRMLAGVPQEVDLDTQVQETHREWSAIRPGEWLKSMLQELRSPDATLQQDIERILHTYLKATLRPYQLTGVSWLWLLYQLQLGGCLADDMGLGKTIQVLALFLLAKYHPKKRSNKQHLLVVPASLLGNWQEEGARFAPSLTFAAAHGGALNDTLPSADVILTTYATLHRTSFLQEQEWDLVILDEAQAIKNPGTKQTTATKALKSISRVALTGTPIENRLGDLWSLFDFTSPALLGSSTVFAAHMKRAQSSEDPNAYSRFITTLKNLTQPYILRRLKTDKSIIYDLPDKTEMQTYCCLTENQVCLYSQAVYELATELEKKPARERRGIILAYLIRFKQICNHPTQWLGYGEYAEEMSGKFMRLREICEEIALRGEKVLVFTQFREIVDVLAAFLAGIFGRSGLVLHGGTQINKRSELVSEFQQDEEGAPFFVLSLKAGGSGLTLTKASHVIHFDRWWNPAVENQATDRAYRIGQKNPVMVHKFICRGTIEEKIDAMITSKKSLSQELLSGADDELSLMELSNEELLNMLTLDITKACGEK